MIRTYKGKDINTLSKKELLEALNFAFDTMEEQKRLNDLERKIAADFRAYVSKYINALKTA